MHRRARALVCAAALAPAGALLAACSSSEGPVVSIALTTGHETDALSRDPAVTEVTVSAMAGTSTLASASVAPGGSFDLGDLDEGTSVSFEASGVTAKGDVVLRGRTLGGIVLGESGSKVPLFVQRRGEWARPPGQLARAHVRAPLAIVGEQWIVATGGAAVPGESASPRETDFYDLRSLARRASASFPRRAESLVSLVDGVVLVGDGGATWVDLAAQTTSELSPPAGLASFDAVAGATPILTPKGEQLLVAATLDAGDEDVLVIGADGSLAARATRNVHHGAGAAWIPSVGLVVAGGTEADPSVEILAEGATAFATRPFPPDATEGAALVATGLGTTAALVGGTEGGAPAPTRTFDAACLGDCAFTTLDGAGVPLVRRTVAYAAAPGRLLAVGDDASGQTRVFLVDLDAPSATELPLREPRAGATPIPGPDGALYIAGGLLGDGTAALTIERLLPE